MGLSAVQHPLAGPTQERSLLGMPLLGAVARPSGPSPAIASSMEGARSFRERCLASSFGWLSSPWLGQCKSTPCLACTWLVKQPLYQKGVRHALLEVRHFPQPIQWPGSPWLGSKSVPCFVCPWLVQSSGPAPAISFRTTGACIQGNRHLPQLSQ